MAVISAGREYIGGASILVVPTTGITYSKPNVDFRSSSIALTKVNVCFGQTIKRFLPL
jgi:hypothetical protein